VAAGIGIFLALIGLTSVGFIVSKPAPILGFGGLSVNIVLFLFGLVFTSFLIIKRVKGALILGIVGTSLLAFISSQIGTAAGLLSKPLVTAPQAVFSLPSLEVFFNLDIKAALAFGMIGPIFALLFTDMFDSISTFLGVAQAADLVDEEGQPVNVHKALLVDAFSTTISGLFGSSSGTTYIESAAGVEEGGKTGMTAVVAGLLFLPFMFLSPLLSFVPAVATAPVLVIVGVFMTRPLVKLNWMDFEEAIPAFIATILIPLTYSITQGIIWGFLVYTFIKLIVGKAKEIHWMLYIIDLFAILSLFLS
jgi:AGZA family xanthine/uracil permease-like MFS transporter